jgi:hypothetical protein
MLLSLWRHYLITTDTFREGIAGMEQYPDHDIFFSRLTQIRKLIRAMTRKTCHQMYKNKIHKMLTRLLSVKNKIIQF